MDEKKKGEKIIPLNPKKNVMEGIEWKKNLPMGLEEDIKETLEAIELGMESHEGLDIEHGKRYPEIERALRKSKALILRQRKASNKLARIVNAYDEDIRNIAYQCVSLHSAIVMATRALSVVKRLMHQN